MDFLHDEKSKGVDRRMIGSLVMLFIGILMGVSIMSILQVASDADDQMEEYAKKKNGERDGKK